MRRLAFLLAIFSIPFQLGYHFWPSYSFLSGYRIDYLSPTIYLSYLAIFGYILVCLPSTFPLLLRKFSLNWKYFLCLFLLIYINIYFSVSPIISSIAWLKIIFYLSFFLTLVSETQLSSRVIVPLSASLFLVVLLELFQFIFQSSLNGPAYLLGERSISLSTPNVAKINLELFGNSYYLLRPYSTFSHPNSLAGFLLLSIILISQYCSHSGLKYLLVIGLLLTASKTAIFAFLLIIVLKFLKPKSKALNSWIFSIVVFIFFLISLSPLLSVTPLISELPFDLSSSFWTRMNFGRSTFELIKEYFLSGTGLGNYLVALTSTLIPSKTFLSTLQPVHSIPLLIFVELGAVGTAMLFLLVRKLFSSSMFRIDSFKQIIIALLVTASLDHYWWTLAQNQLLLVVTFAIYYTHGFRRNSNQY